MPHAQGVKDFERVGDELVLCLTVTGEQIAGVADVVNAVHGNAGGGDDVGDMVLAVAADGVDHVLAAEEMFLGDDALVALAEQVLRAGEFEEGGRALLGGGAEPDAVVARALERLDHDSGAQILVPPGEFVGTCGEQLPGSTHSGGLDRLDHRELVAAGGAELRAVGRQAHGLAEPVGELDAELAAGEDRHRFVRTGGPYGLFEVPGVDDVVGVERQVQGAGEGRRDLRVLCTRTHAWPASWNSGGKNRAGANASTMTT